VTLTPPSPTHAGEADAAPIPSGAPATGVTTPSRLRLVLPRRGAVERDHAETVFRALAEGRWAGAPRRVKVYGLNATWLGDLEVGGRTLGVTLKQTVPAPGVFAALRALSPRRRSVRQWRGARRLRALRIPVGSPILLARGVVQGRPCDWLLLERVPGVDLLSHLALDDLSVQEQHDAAKKAGAIVNRIDSYGWFNRDTKLSNLIRTPDGEITLIDTVDIQRRPGRRVRMLRAMLYEAIGHGVLPRRPLLMRCLRAAVEEPRDAWRALEREALRIKDPVPRGQMTPRSVRA